VTELAPAWPNAIVRGMPPYRGPETIYDFPRGPGAPRMRFLHLNESAYPPSPRAVAAVTGFASDLHRYPDIHCHALAAALASRTGIPAKQILFGSGSDELIHFLIEISVTAGDEIVIPSPTFPRYAHTATLCGAKVVRTRLDAAGAPDADALLKAIGSRTRLVFACTPNNPSGGMMTAAAVEALARGVPVEVLLVVDEAYWEFARHAGGPDLLPILQRRRGHWLSLRTFSKAYALSALRVGYALCGSPAVADSLRKAKLQFNVNAVAQAAALAALEDESYLAETLARSAGERQRIAAGATRLGLVALPSTANFQCVRLPFSAELAMNELAKRHILVRDWRDPNHRHELRITVGLPEDTDALLAALAEICRTQGVKAA
jgi:histidinol-phosphate aminotransferase